jgi:hypothetical protein
MRCCPPLWDLTPRWCLDGVVQGVGGSFQCAAILLPMRPAMWSSMRDMRGIDPRVVTDHRLLPSDTTMHQSPAVLVFVTDGRRTPTACPRQGFQAGRQGRVAAAHRLHGGAWSAQRCGRRAAYRHRKSRYCDAATSARAHRIERRCGR